MHQENVRNWRLADRANILIHFHVSLIKQCGLTELCTPNHVMISLT